MGFFRKEEDILWEGQRNINNVLAKDLELKRVKIDTLERELGNLKSKIDELSKKNHIVAEGISNTKAIIQALEISGKTLHYKEIFDIIKNYDLKRPHVTLDTIRGASYQLVKRKKIKNGKKPGTFYFKEQKDS